MTTTEFSTENLTLAHGAHTDRSEGVCLMEAVAWYIGGAHTDHPACVSPLLGAFGRNLNDRLPEDRRQELIPFITRLPGTAGDGRDPRRLQMINEWLRDRFAARLLDQAGRSDIAVKFRRVQIPLLPATAATATDAAADTAADTAAAATTAATTATDTADVAADAATAAAAAGAAGAAATAADAAAADAAAAGAAAAVRYWRSVADAYWAMRNVSWDLRRGGWRAYRLIALHHITATTYQEAYDQAMAVLAPLVSQVQGELIELLGALIEAEPAGD